MLIDPTAEELAEIYADGITEGAKLVDMEVNLDQLNERALEWARERAADLVTQIEENTRDMLQDTVAQAIEEGWGADELAGQIADSTGFSDDRAETIARTELIAANNAGNLRAYRESGVATGKEWVTAGDDLVEEDCQANEDQGPIGLDEDFDSGDDAPPAHPNCRCSILPVIEPLDGEATDEEE